MHTRERLQTPNRKTAGDGPLATATPEIESCNSMQLNPFSLRIAPRDALQHNATQPRSSYNPRPSRLETNPAPPKAGSAVFRQELFLHFRKNSHQNSTQLRRHPFTPRRDQGERGVADPFLRRSGGRPRWGAAPTPVRPEPVEGRNAPSPAGAGEGWDGGPSSVRAEGNRSMNGGAATRVTPPCPSPCGSPRGTPRRCTSGCSRPRPASGAAAASASAARGCRRASPAATPAAATARGSAPAPR